MEKIILKQLHVENNKFFNISNVQLSDEEKCIISLGFKNLPYHPLVRNDFERDCHNSLEEFGRLLKLKLFFEFDDNNVDTTIPSIVNKSSNSKKWLPDEDAFSKEIDDYSRNVKTMIMKELSPINMTQQQKLIYKTYKRIQERVINNEMKIRMSDKGIGIAVMDKADYVTMAMEHLSNEKQYIVIKDLDIPAIYEELKTILNNYDKLYDYNEYETLTDLAKSLLQLEKSELLRIGVIDFNPKMHKKYTTRLPPTRAITNTINTAGYHVSRYLHNLLKPLRNEVETICTSSNNFLVDISTIEIGEHDVLICSDYKNLYGSIQNAYGIEAIYKFLKQLAEKENPIIPEDQINFICDLLNWTLNNNYIQFEQIIYKQIYGTATGIPGSVVYADFVCVILEQPCLLQCADMIKLFRRYIDDIFAIAHKDCKIIEIINQQNQDIKTDMTTYTIGEVGIFLDVRATIITINGKREIQTTLYQKDICTYPYLTPHTAHNNKILKNLITSQLASYRLKDSNDSDYNNDKMNLYKRLIARGHNIDDLAIAFCYNPNRTELFEKVKTQRNKITANNNDNNINNINTKPLVIITKTPNPLIKIPWKQYLAYTNKLSTNEKFKRCILKRPIIVGRRNNYAASYYLCKHNNLLPSLNDENAKGRKRKAVYTTSTPRKKRIIQRNGNKRKLNN